ncbi:MAG: hypothetical protein K6E11_01270 [Bacilli bacterium]|nr:hypothetical protein [Bacilli bacterium]
MRRQLFLLLIPLLLTGCNVSEKDESNSSSKSTTSDITSTTSNNTSSNPTSTHSEQSSGGEREGEWFDRHVLLDCGYYSMGLPKNSASPINLVTDNQTSSWNNNSIITSSDLGNFRYIYKNACDDGETGHKTSLKMYQNDAGGIKMTEPGCGIGSPMFSHTGNKLEIRFKVSQVSNASPDTQNDEKTAGVYFFNASEELIGQVYIPNDQLNKKGKTPVVYFTENAKDVAYFEFRMKAMPHNGSQSFNIGISEVNFKSWPNA